jgi:peptide-methionine (S)-S-oxide reductase
MIVGCAFKSPDFVALSRTQQMIMEGGVATRAATAQARASDHYGAVKQHPCRERRADRSGCALWTTHQPGAGSDQENRPPRRFEEDQMIFGSRFRSSMVSQDKALPGRSTRPYSVPARHAVLKTSLQGPWPAGTQVLYVAMGCFWGAEKAFWRVPGVVTTAVGYQGGYTPNPTYEETCTGQTGHTEAVMIAYDPARVSAEQLFQVFWESHDPTQGYRQGNDVGTQYRSAVYWTTDQQQAAYESTKAAYQASLKKSGYGQISTDARPAAAAGPFYFAEDYHQQYLYKVPNGYCPSHSTGVSCPVGLDAGPAKS